VVTRPVACFISHRSTQRVSHQTPRFRQAPSKEYASWHIGCSPFTTPLSSPVDSIDLPAAASEIRARSPGRSALCAVVLAAGMGSRLGRRTDDTPKCLVEVNGGPILFNALHCLERANVCQTVLVVGHLDHVIRRRVGARVGAMRIDYRVNREYRTTSTSRSLWIGLAQVDADVLVLEGDVYFESRVLDHFLEAPFRNATLVEAWNPSLNGSVVELGPSRTVRAWRHQTARGADFVLDGTYKTVNVHRFSRAFVRKRLRPALAREAARGGREPIETVFAQVVAEGGRIRAVPASGQWVEIDDEGDLQKAEAMFAGGRHEHR
jgi:NDP-sugar pyrophosphorylase family protein